MIRTVNQKDASQIANIYNHYILHSTITFEETPISPDEMEQRISKHSPTHPWFVYEEKNHVVAYAYATPWKNRSAYKHSVETSIYINHSSVGKGIGTQLYTYLIDHLKEQKHHSLIGGIALPNEASIHLHEKLEFKKVAHFKEVGYKFNQWVDVGYWQLILQ